MDYESQPTAEFNGATNAGAEDNHSDKTGSEGSEGFVKVEDVESIDHNPTILEKPTIDSSNKVEPVSGISQVKKNHLESALLEHLGAKDMADVVNEVRKSDQEEPESYDDGGKGEGKVKELAPENNVGKLSDVEEGGSHSPALEEVPVEAPVEDPIPRKSSNTTSPIPENSSETTLSASFHLAPSGGVVDLLFWRDIRTSGLVFSFSFIILLSLRYFSVIAVVAYISLALLAVTVSIRLYKFVLQTLNGSQQPNPFQSLLDADIALSRDLVDRYLDIALKAANYVIITTRDLVLVRNLSSSIKFGLSMWLLTYIGCCFNGLTILTIDLILAFSLPPIYEKYQGPIDAYFTVVCNKASNVYSLIKSKIPGVKKKTQ